MIESLYEPFKKWSDGGSVWLISDPHFDDEDTKLMNPNWIEPKEYVDILNKNIHKGDTLVCLGDCGELEWFKKIKVGYKVLVKGNHDDRGNSYYKSVFDEVYSGALFIAPQILLSHEPIYGLQFCVNIHGHCHNGTYDYTDEQGGRHLNIAADVVGFRQLNLGKAIKRGLVAGLPTVHRLTIDRAIANPIHKKGDTDEKS